MGNTEKFIIYTRVSTEEQADGWSLASQENSCRDYVAGKGECIGVFSDVASGFKNSKRKGLDAAIDAARISGASIVVWALDRLGRNAAKLHAIHESETKIHIATKGEMSFMEFSIFAMLAQEESERISRRTRAGLAQRERETGKRNGGDGTCRDGEKKSKKAATASVAARKEKARMATIDAAKVIRELRRDGLSYAAIAAKLEAFEVPTAKGGKWTAARVRQLVILHGFVKEDKQQ